jgi:hypothetical protein
MKLSIKIVVYDDSWKRLASRDVMVDELTDHIDLLRVSDGTGRQVTGLIESVAYQTERDEYAKRDAVLAGTEVSEVECE